MLKEYKDFELVALCSLVLSVLGALLVCALCVDYPIDYKLVDSITFFLSAVIAILLVIRLVRDWPKRFDYLEEKQDSL